MTFSKLGLCEPILKAVLEQGYTAPTPIQAKVIPEILAGRSVVASAQTGTGKTAGFVLPILERLKGERKRRAKRMRALIIEPTRELAVQAVHAIQPEQAVQPALDVDPAQTCAGCAAKAGCSACAGSTARTG